MVETGGGGLPSCVTHPSQTLMAGSGTQNDQQSSSKPSRQVERFQGLPSDRTLVGCWNPTPSNRRKTEHQAAGEMKGLEEDGHQVCW